MPSGEFRPGQLYYVKALVGRGANDIPAASVPVEIWAQQTRQVVYVQGSGSFTQAGEGPAMLIARKLVDLSSSASVAVIVPWTVLARVDATYDVRVRVDPEGQIAQYSPDGGDTASNDIGWAARDGRAACLTSTQRTPHWTVRSCCRRHPSFSAQSAACPRSDLR